VYPNFFGLNAVHVKSKEIRRSFLLRTSCYIVNQLQGERQLNSETVYGNRRLLSIVVLTSKRAEEIFKTRQGTILTPWDKTDLKTMNSQSVYLVTKETWEPWIHSPYILWLNGPETSEETIWTFSDRTHMITVKRQTTCWARRDLRSVKRKALLLVTELTYDLWKDGSNILRPMTCEETIWTSWNKTALRPVNRRFIHYETSEMWRNGSGFLRQDKPGTYGGRFYTPTDRYEIWESSYVVSEGHETERRPCFLKQSRLHTYHVTTKIMMMIMIMMIMLMQFSLQCHVFRFKFKSNVCIAKWNMAPRHLVRHSNESLLGFWCE
jgi:hypothetical protein